MELVSMHPRPCALGIVTSEVLTAVCAAVGTSVGAGGWKEESGRDQAGGGSTDGCAEGTLGRAGGHRALWGRVLSWLPFLAA